MKSGRTDHLRYFLGKRSAFDDYWQSYKIAVRNGYEITDISLWCDYVDMLRRLGRDTQPEVPLPCRPQSRARPQTGGNRPKTCKGGDCGETAEGYGRRKAFPRTQIQVLRYMLHGRNNPSPRFGERA